ncbi:Ig-like domain-containing protein [Patescibacteria group bacterium]|nr:Ig-like domain-containing protein [Patescibacteria group bacterium]
MTDVNDTNAEAFDRALSGASDGRHPEGLRPFLEMTDALRRDAEASMGRLDPATAAKQRADLMHMSETKKQEVNNEKRATAPVGDEHVIVAMPEAKEKGVEKRDARSGMPFRISTWAGGAVGVLAVAVIAIGVMMRGQVFFQKASDAGRAVSRILIPEALAGDAFMLVAEEEDAAGADIGTAFRITSKVDVTEEALRQNLRIVPPIEVDVKQMGSREFRVIPKDPLEPGKVYRLTAATVVEKSDGTTSAREFSWAVQTKDVFRVLASVPGDQSSGVPVDTAIEITMSQAGWEDPTASFSIEPKVEGRFETHGRSLVFLPAKPFEPGRIYTVTLRKGWKLAESGLGLESDAVIRFETAARASSDADRTISLMPVGAFFESAPDEDAFLNVREPYGRFTADGALVTGYALTADDAVALIRKVYAIPFWAYETGKRGDDFRPYAVTKAFEADVALERNDETYSSFLRLPGQKPGLYLILIQPTSTKPEAVSEESWAVMQVTDAATYAISDASETVLWVMNLDSQKPLSSLPVTLEGVAGQTDADGVVRLPTPAALSSTSTDGETRLAIAYVGSGEMSAVVPISRRGWWAYGYGPSGNTGASVGYLYLDRPLYRIGDTLSFFGVVQDRVTKQGASSVTVQITGSVRDYLTYRSKVYVEERVTPDEDGFFRGKLSWETMAPGSYQVTVLRDGDVVTSRMIEIRDVVKPAFTIDITPTEDQLFAGQDLTGQVRVRLFDGTPVSNKAIRLTVSGHDDNGSLEVMTDDAGIASFSFATARQTCDPAAEYTGCWDSWTDMVEARPVEAEEADIYGMAFVSLWPARLSAMTEIATKGSDATVSFLVRRVDLSAALGREERSVLTTPLSGIRLTGKVVERRWERIELGPEQSRYDIILKRVVPSYRYEIRERDVQAIDVTTGADGRATLRVPMSDGVSYRFYASATDEAGAIETVAGSFAKGWYDRWGPDGSSRGISLEPTTPRDDRPGYGMDEEVSVTFVKDGERLPDASSPSFLYVEASRGIRTVSASGRSTYAFRYRGDLIPNMTLYGVAFGPTGFQETSYSASFDTDARRLKVTVTADPATSVPSGKITATVDVRDQLGNPVKGARVAFGAVDESLLAASSMGDLVESPLTSLYGWVSDGIVASRKSHMALGEDLWMSPGYGGAEMGGGGSEAIRRTFKDTATFDVVTTDGGGRATFAFTAPDNITSWRLSAVAVTKGLSAGYDRTKLAVTKPVFVDAVVPETLLATDAPVLKIRAYGVGLATGDPITFRVDAPTLGITNAVVTGTAGTPAYVAVDRLTVGTHDVVLRVEAKGGSDALLRKVTVVPSRFTRADFVSTDLAPGTALPDIGTSPEVDVRFSSLAQSR